MELDILERMTRDKEEREARAATKEALVSKTASVGTSSNLDKGKYPMGEIPQTSVEQQVKDYLQTYEQIKQKLNRMTSALDTQEVATSQSPKIAQVTTLIENTLPKKTQVEDKPSEIKKIPILVPTIDLTHSEEEEEKISPMHVSV